MPYEVQLEDGMRVQVSSLNGQDWSDYREKLLGAARAARRLTPESDYTTVLAIIKADQWPSDTRARHCLKRWQSCLSKQLELLEEASNRARDSEVPRAATTQPHQPETACRQVHEKTADATMTHSERAEPIAPADGSRDPPDTPPEDGARHRAGEGVDEVGRTGAGGDNEVDHTQTAPTGINDATQSKPHSDAAHRRQRGTRTVSPRRHDGATTAARNSDSTNNGPRHENARARVPGAGTSHHHHRDSTHAAPRRDANAGAGDGMRAQRRGAHRRCRGRREGGGSDAEPRERPGAAKPGVQSGPGTHLHHRNPSHETSRVEMSEDETTTARPHPPKSMPLEGEHSGQTSGGSTGLTACKTNWPTKTSASAWSASCDHPAMSTDTPRPSEDTGDATGDDEHRPDAPTEPPDTPKGTRGRGGELKAETRTSGMSRGAEEDAGSDGDEERRARKPDEPTGRPQDRPRDRTDVQVDPGERTAHRSAGAVVDGEVVGTRRDMQVEGESARMRRRASIAGESESANAHVRSTRADEENDQRTKTAVDDVPETPPEPPPPPTDPSAPSIQGNKPPSVELEGETKALASFDATPTRAETDASRASGSAGDVGNRSKKLRNASEHEHERSMQRTRIDSPGTARDEQHDLEDEADASGASVGDEDAGKRPMKLRNALEQVPAQSDQSEEGYSLNRPPDEPYESDDETVVPGDLQGTQGCPIDDGNARGGETNPPSRGTGPGGHRGDQEARRGDEVDSGHLKVSKRAEYDEVRTRSDGNVRVIETDALRPEKDPGGPEGEQDELGSVGSDWERRNDGEVDGYDGNGDQRSGATSGARRDSKRVETKTLAEDDARSLRSPPSAPTLDPVVAATPSGNGCYPVIVRAQPASRAKKR